LLKTAEARYRRGELLDRRQCATTISSLRRCAFWARAVLLLAVLVRDRLVPDAVVYNAAISSCAEGGNWRWALHMLRELGDSSLSPTVITYNAVGTACVRAAEWCWVLAVLEEMREAGLRPSRITYTVALSACRQEGPSSGGRDAGRPRFAALLARMEADRVLPDSAVYNGAIGAASASLCWPSAFDLLERMQHRALSPNVLIFSSVISACGASSIWRGAARMLADMRVRGSPTNVVSHNAAVGASVAAGQWLQTLALFAGMRRAGFAPDIATVNTAVRAWTSNWHWRQASELLTRMRALGFSGLATGPRDWAAKRSAEVVDKLQRLHAQRSVPPLLASKGALREFGRDALWERALRLLVGMSDAAVLPDVSSYDMVSRACKKASQWRWALQVSAAQPELTNNLIM